MADIRIKDLTTTASSSASDDFIAVDGTTNGTRKLSAFSPTFGGNATVTGTLTANGLLTAAATTSLDGLPTAAIFGATKRIAIGYNTSGDYGFIASADSGTTWKELHLNPSGGLVKVPSTSASTTTSTGALVVGNGTSGGLGVGGNINAGGYLRSINSSAANGSEFTALRADVGADGTLGAALVTIGVLPSATAASRYGFITCYDNGDWRTLYLGGSPGVAANGGQVRVPATTASTSTSTGALVVSGGVGVGNEVSVYGRVRAQLGLHADGNVPAGLAAAYQVDVQAGTSRDILSFGDSSRAGLIRGEQDGSGRATLKFGRYTASTFAEYLRITGVAATDAVLSVFGTTASTSTSSGALVVSGGVGVAGAVNVGGNLTVNGTITLYPDQDGFFSGSWPRMNFTTNGSSVWLSGATTGAATVQHDFRNRSGTSLLTLGGTGNAIFAGNLKTAAPAGGTAAEWKLGTVATVSPTSPNRTIEVDIGGTIYYIHAKTTNN